MLRKKVVLAGFVVTCVAMLGCMQNNKAQAAAKYKIGPKSKPCAGWYTNEKNRQYYTIQSYLDKCKKKGGTLILTKGTYKIPATLRVPSKVTIQLKKGVILKKTDKTGQKTLKSGKVMLKLNGAKSVTIKGAKGSYIQLGKVAKAVGIQSVKGNTVKITGISFQKRNAGAYINLKGTKNVTVQGCSFAEGSTVSKTPAISLATVETNSVGGLTIQKNTFQKVGVAVGQGTYKASQPSNNVVIQNNTLKNIGTYGISGKVWNQAKITGNKFTHSDGNVNTAGIMLYSATNPTITGNTFQSCKYAIKFDRAGSTNNKVEKTYVDQMTKDTNKVSKLTYYYIPMNNGSETRLGYFYTASEKNLTVTPASTPYRNHYTDLANYTANSSQAALYYTFRSYMDQLEATGGGTLHVSAGTYLLSHSVCVPSNVTVDFADGVVIKKVKATDVNMATNKTLFELVPPSMEETVATIGSYNGSHNVTLKGSGSVVFDCDNILNAMGVTMGHCKEITIQDITFQNEYGSHFIELNSSQNVTVKNCSFSNFKVYDFKSHKEAINVDSDDANNSGFGYLWANHDRTACNGVNIENCGFSNVGTAVGSHTYSVDTSNNQIYHEKVTIKGCKVDQTYNSAIRILNWRDCNIADNTMVNVQSLDDKKAGKYPVIYARGVVNPTITNNYFDRSSNVRDRWYAVGIKMRTSASVGGAVDAGYADTISSLSEENLKNLQENTIGSNACYKKFRITNEDGTFTKILFNHLASSVTDTDSDEEDSANTNESE